MAQDRWFSEVAGDEVTVLVLRPMSQFVAPGYSESLRGFDFSGELRIPQLPKVCAFQEIFREGTGIRLAIEYFKLIRSWTRREFDLLITPIGHFHTYASWGRQPLVFETTTNSIGLEETGAKTLGGRLKRAFTRRLHERFDLIVAYNYFTLRLLEGHGFGHKTYYLRHLVDPSELHQSDNSETERNQTAMVDELRDRHAFVVMQFNRLVDYKNPHLFLDVAEQFPEAGFVLAGDGPLRSELQSRIVSSPKLRDRVRLLGCIRRESLGTVTRSVSCFLLTSTIANDNNVLYESMALGNAPVAVVDNYDLPPEFADELVLKLPKDPSKIAARLRELLSDSNRAETMQRAAREHVLKHHSAEQMWKYRESLLRIADLSTEGLTCG